MSNSRNIADIFSKSTAISTDTEVSTAVVTERTTVATLSGKTLLAPAMTNIIITPSSTTSTPITINGIASQSGDYLNINTLATGGTNLIKIDVNGNVGIGKTASVKLDVNGVVNATGFTIGGVSIATPAATPSVAGTLLGYSAVGYTNTSLGYLANNLTAGSLNTSIGASTLLNVSGSYNTAVGYGAGSGINSGTYNTLIGYNAGSGTGTYLTTGSNNMVIGNNAATSSSTVSNEITLGDSNITALRIPGLGINASGGGTSQTNIGIQSGSQAKFWITAQSGINYLSIGGNGGSAPTSGAINIDGSLNSIFNGQMQSIRANNTADGSGQIYLNGSTGNRIDFGGSGIATPTFTTRSVGTKIVLFPNVNSTAVDYAIGIESLNIWQSVPNSTGGFKWYAGQTNIGSLSGTGTFTVTGNVTAYSDERLKSNIKTIENPLEKISQIRGVSFDKDGKNQIGVIAQEIQKILPEVVEEGEYLSVAYGNIVGLLIEAIKEQQNQIEDLKNRLV